MRLSNKARIKPGGPQYARPRPESATARARAMFDAGWSGSSVQLAAALGIEKRQSGRIIDRLRPMLEPAGYGAWGLATWRKKA